MARGMKPYYFNMVIWGERYRRYLADYCLPSLLSPGNIPALGDLTSSRFLIATTKEDWAEIQKEPILDRLAAHVRPEFVAIPPPPPGVSSCVHMGVGHKLVTTITAENRARGVFLTPDLLVSDGTLRTANQRAEAGAGVVLIAAYRFRDRPLLDLINATGRVRPGEPLCISSRELTDFGLRSLHSETECYEWQTSHFSDCPVACYWHVPGNGGIVLHAFSWAMLVLDYDHVGSHDTKTLDGWTIDGDYLFRNMRDLDRLALLTDSDDGMLVSWSPEPKKRPYWRDDLAKSAFFLGDLLKGIILDRTFHSAIYDPNKRALFFTPVRWHSGELDERWSRTEERALTTLLRSVKLSSEELNAANQVRGNHGLPPVHGDTPATRQIPLRLRASRRALLLSIRMQHAIVDVLRPVLTLIRRRREFARLGFELAELYLLIIPIRLTVPRIFGRARWLVIRKWLMQVRLAAYGRSLDW